MNKTNIIRLLEALRDNKPGTHRFSHATYDAAVKGGYMVERVWTVQQDGGWTITSAGHALIARSAKRR